MSADPKHPKYAPADADGNKPYIVTIKTWGRSYDLLVYSPTAASAKYQAVGRQQHTSGHARRALWNEVAR